MRAKKLEVRQAVQKSAFRSANISRGDAPAKRQAPPCQSAGPAKCSRGEATQGHEPPLDQPLSDRERGAGICGAPCRGEEWCGAGAHRDSPRRSGLAPRGKARGRAGPKAASFRRRGMGAIPRRICAAGSVSGQGGNEFARAHSRIGAMERFRALPGRGLRASAVRPRGPVFFI